MHNCLLAESALAHLLLEVEDGVIEGGDSLVQPFRSLLCLVFVLLQAERWRERERDRVRERK